MRGMSDTEQETEYRLAAADCFERAKQAPDEARRRELLQRAQNWVERADSILARRHLSPREIGPHHC